VSMQYGVQRRDGVTFLVRCTNCIEPMGGVRFPVSLTPKTRNRGESRQSVRSYGWRNSCMQKCHCYDPWSRLEDFDVKLARGGIDPFFNVPSHLLVGLTFVLGLCTFPSILTVLYEGKHGDGDE